MKSLPSELIYLLIFAAIVLFQFMMKQLAQKAEQQPQQQPQDSMPEEFVAQTYGEAAEAAAAPAPSRLTAGHFGRTEAPKAAPATVPVRRRFSRKSLMGNKRDVQNAVVIAAILGPCRAFEPHDVH